MPSPIARGAPVTVGRFLADVDRIAAEFPAGQHVLNACTDRYRFAVGLAAALVAGKVSLLPANLAPDTLRQLRKSHRDLFCLADSDHPVLDLPRMLYRDAVAIGEPSPEIAVPEIDADQPVAWLFTSGSTGEPVPHLKTWGALVRSVGIEADRLGLRVGRGARDRRDRSAAARLRIGVVGAGRLARRCRVQCAHDPSTRSTSARRLSEVPRPRVLVSTPFHLRLLLDSGAEVPEIDLVVSATAPLSSALVSGGRGSIRRSAARDFRQHRHRADRVAPPIGIAGVASFHRGPTVAGGRPNLGFRRSCRGARRAERRR